ncbi:hypothetical protein [Azospirillum argentinense]
MKAAPAVVRTVVFLTTLPKVGRPEYYTEVSVERMHRRADGRSGRVTTFRHRATREGFRDHTLVRMAPALAGKKREQSRESFLRWWKCFVFSISSGAFNKDLASFASSEPPRHRLSSADGGHEAYPSGK